MGRAKQETPKTAILVRLEAGLVEELKAYAGTQKRSVNLVLADQIATWWQLHASRPIIQGYLAELRKAEAKIKKQTEPAPKKPR